MTDEMDDTVGNAYSGMPDRLVLVDQAGKVVYKGGRGPFGYKPGELEQAMVMLLLDQTHSKPIPRVPAGGNRRILFRARFSVLVAVPYWQVSRVKTARAATRNGLANCTACSAASPISLHARPG